MSGIIRLYAAVLLTPPLEQGKVLTYLSSMYMHIQVIYALCQPHPHGLENGWTWLSRIINTDPQPGITATALYDFLEVGKTRH